MNVHAVLRECATDLLSTEPNVTVDQIVGCAYRRHGDTFREAQEQMVIAAAKAIVAKLMRDLTEDDHEQLELAGMGGLPSAIAIPGPDGTYYVRSDKATWPELLIGRDVRGENVAAAAAKLAAYDETLESLRPLMEHDHSLTVAAAVRHLGEVAA